MSEPLPNPNSTPSPAGGDHASIDTAAPGASRGKAMVRGLAPTLAFDIVLPLVTYYALRAAGLGVVPSYLLSGVWPLGKLIVGFVRNRRVDAFGVIVCVFIALGVGIALVSGDPRAVVARDSMLTGGFGIVLLVSLLFPRPLLFYVGRTFATDGSEAGMARWDGLWRYPSFRRSQIQITTMWGVGFLIEAIARVVMVYTMSDLDLVIGIFGIAPAIVTALLIGATIMIGRRAAAAGAARQRAREQAEAGDVGAVETGVSEPDDAAARHRSV